MRTLRRSWLPAVGIVCLGFTGSSVAWAQPAHADYVEDPLAPHVTRGSTARVGTTVGFIYGERLDVTAVGLTTAIGQRWGRLALDAEYSYLTLQARGPSSQRLGDAQRLGVIGRFDVLRFDSHKVGANSLLSFYIEGGAAVAWNDWYMPAFDEASRVVPIDTKRVEGQAGFGIELDHRLQEPIGFPRRIGWFLGWRLSMAPHATEDAAICRGSQCKAAPAMAHERYTDRSMLFQSSLSFTW